MSNHTKNKQQTILLEDLYQAIIPKEGSLPPTKPEDRCGINEYPLEQFVVHHFTNQLILPHFFSF